jgi:D-amino peptidase
MTAEANAAIEGCFEGGASEVIVNDSHGTMLNLIQGDLDRRARVIRGRNKGYGMVHGLDWDTAAALCIGYHAAAGNGDGVLNHTMNGRDLHGVFLNGEPAGELRLNAAYAGWLGVPVVLVSGDDVVCAESRSFLGAAETVVVKEAIDKYTALSLHPLEAQDRIRAAATRAVSQLAEFVPYRIETPTTLRIEWNSTSVASTCEGIPGVMRVGSREIEYRSDDYPELYRLLRVLLAISAARTAAPYTYD